MTESEQLTKWRLILGGVADPEDSVALDENLQGMSNTLDALYDSNKKGGLGASSPNVNRWLGDIRQYFPTPVVQLLQRDALDRLGLQRMLLEPELLAEVEPDVHLAATLLTLSKILPDKSRETARMVVRKVVQQLEQRLKTPLLRALRGSLLRADRTRRPHPRDIDWQRTIRANLKNYQPEFRTVIPEQLLGYKRRKNAIRHLLLLIDQSGSMASSVVYAGVLGSVMASVSSLKTRIIAFDTSVTDLTEMVTDPVDLLFGIQLGGGTDINHALAYAERHITQPRDTVIVLLSDLFEGGDAKSMLNRMGSLHSSGAQVVCLLALNDEGAPAYDHNHAHQLAQMGIPAFACTPDYFPEVMAAAIERRPVKVPPANSR